jgi:hypothetical protein
MIMRTTSHHLALAVIFSNRSQLGSSGTAADLGGGDRRRWIAGGAGTREWRRGEICLSAIDAFIEAAIVLGLKNLYGADIDFRERRFELGNWICPFSYICNLRHLPASLPDDSESSGCYLRGCAVVGDYWLNSPDDPDNQNCQRRRTQACIHQLWRMQDRMSTAT